MAIIVQKFGGTSVADTAKIMAAARKAVRAQQDGHQVVMVVSAMGKNTDMLVELANEISGQPPAREMDMLLSTGEQVSVALMAMAIDALGHKAVSLTGAQIGVRTDSTHTNARIISISTARMQSLLDAGNIVIAAGFQGIDEDFNITTLGRGGSDTTAVSLAAVLGASCEIYTDVDGVYTTDPRKLPEARKVSRVSYDEMLEIASVGAGVMHSRSIEFAKKYAVPIHVRSSMSDGIGTIIAESPESHDRAVSTAAVTMDEARITLSAVPDLPGTSHAVFSVLANENITVDMVVQDVGDNGKSNISFTVPEAELDLALKALKPVAGQMAFGAITHDANVAKVSVVGLGMAQQTGVAETMFKVLAEKDINIFMITTSEIKISCLVEREVALDALRAVHNAYDLHVQPENVIQVGSPSEEIQRDEATRASVAERLRGVGMEDLSIESITLDDSQSSVSILGLTDRPGVADTVFSHVAKAGVLVDMIILSYSEQDGNASMSFTCPAESREAAIAALEQLKEEVGFREIVSQQSVGKLSVAGVGLRSHTGVGIRMFRSLSEAGINVDMINTSEVNVNVIVNGQHNERALEELEDAFADVLR